MSYSSEMKNNTTSKGVEGHESNNPSSSNCTTLSKNAAKKEQKKLEKQRLQQKATESNWTEIRLLNKELEGKEVLIGGAVQSIRFNSSETTFLVLRQNGCTVRCVVSYAPDVVNEHMVRYMVKYLSRLNKESIVEVNGIVIHKEDIKTTTQKVELQMTEIYCICRTIRHLMPVSRLHRELDTSITANQAIFAIERKVENIFRIFLASKGFADIHILRMIAGTVVYNDQPACLAQFPQLHKQMTVCGNKERIFEVGPVFRAEKSDIDRHLCEFTGIDVEMDIYLHYSEVIEIVDELFVAIFDGLNENCKKELEAVGKQFPFEPFKYLRETLVLPFQEGVKMLQIAGVEIGIEDDLNTEAQKKLGQLVLERYNTEFYILDRYPLKVRPFYTMPCYDDPKFSNSFDVFMRGEKIVSGAQGIDDPELLRTRAKACGIDVQSQAISTYINLVRNGVPGPHGGFGVGLEHVVMLFCALSEYLRYLTCDPKRLAP